MIRQRDTLDNDEQEIEGKGRERKEGGKEGRRQLIIRFNNAESIHGLKKKRLRRETEVKACLEWIGEAESEQLVMASVINCFREFCSTEVHKNEKMTSREFFKGRRYSMLDLFVCSVFFFFFLCFLGLHLQHMEDPRLVVKQELQQPAYTTAIATQDPSCIFHLATAHNNAGSLTH